MKRTELTCEHCGLKRMIPFKATAPTADDLKPWVEVYYMPFVGNYKLFCDACIALLKNTMEEFIK